MVEQVTGRDTAILPVVTSEGLVGAVLTDPGGRVLYSVWIPPGTRMVMRGQRVFMHFRLNEWRQVPVLELGADGRPV